MWGVAAAPNKRQRPFDERKDSMTHPINDLSALYSTDREQQYRALKQLKTLLIGHDDNKRASVEHIPEFLMGLVHSEHATEEIKKEAVVILGSYAYGPADVVDAILQTPIVDCITQLISQQLETSPSIVVSCLRVLVTIYTVHPGQMVISRYPSLYPALEHILSYPGFSQRAVQQCCLLLPLLSPTKVSKKVLSNLSHVLAVRLASYMRTYEQTGAKPLALDAVITALAHLITPSCAIGLLSEPGGDKAEASGTMHSVLSPSRVLANLIRLTKDQDPYTRLSAVELLTKLQKHATGEKQAHIMSQPLLPTLVPVLDLLPEDPRTALVLACICRDNKAKAEQAAEIGLIGKIMGRLKTMVIGDYATSELASNYLLVLGGIGLHSDAFRIDIVNAGGLKLVTSIMTLPPGEGAMDRIAVRRLKISACHVLRSLSRSVASLRTNLSSADLTDGIFELLRSKAETSKEDDEDLEVKSAAMAAVCNLILEFSPLRKPMLDKGILDDILEGTHSRYNMLKLNAVWALKHTIYGRDSCNSVKALVLNRLSTVYLVQLCNDPDLAVQEQAMDVMRNLVCQNKAVTEQLFEEIGTEDFFSLLESKLFGRTFANYPQIVSSAVFTLVHIAANGEQYRDMIIGRRELLKRLLLLLDHDHCEIRQAVVWLIINLTWLDEHGDSLRDVSCRSRAARLAELGFSQELEKRSKDATLDVRERSKTALFQIDELLNRHDDSD
ncbi:hypothetical protein TRVA0_006S03488 [Trichomonascus vanleenenianus]|uniref:glucose-induced degradation complex subunit VID28 n=1 Tax=Trichomonascus vanleenenianus TaxID=2268995 RepID=UPI003ECA3901